MSAVASHCFVSLQCLLSNCWGQDGGGLQNRLLWPRCIFRTNPEYYEGFVMQNAHFISFVLTRNMYRTSFLR